MAGKSQINLQKYRICLQKKSRVWKMDVIFWMWSDPFFSQATKRAPCLGEPYDVEAMPDGASL